MSIYGIDLGTTYTNIAKINKDGQPEVIRNLDENTHNLANAINIDMDNQIIVGEEAKEYDHAIQYIGVDVPTYILQGKEYTAEDLISLIFKEIVHIAKQQDEDVRDVIITVPCYYHKYDVIKIVQVAKNIGLNVVDVITDPVAIALSYAHRLSNEDKYVLVYDLGGGTLDLTLLNIDTVPKIICNSGNNRLGGKDWDSVLFNYIMNQFVLETGCCEDDIDDSVLLYIRNHVAQIKKRLTLAQKATINIPFKGTKIRITIMRDTFEELTMPLVNQTMQYVEDLLTKKNIEVDKVLLAGGCTYMPTIRKALEDRFPGKVLFSEPDTAGAKGAVIYGQMKVMHNC